MDLAYDHIQEQTHTLEEQSKTPEKKTENTLNSEIQEAYKVISSSPWGIKLGGFLESVVKQSGEVYKEAQKELNEVSEEASRGLTGLRSTIISRTGDFSFKKPSNESPTRTNNNDRKELASDESKEELASDESKEPESILTRFKVEATKRFKEIERAENAADEALIRFGSNISSFLRGAVTIAPPSNLSEIDHKSILFESKDAASKRVLHTTRFDAQLHAIHTCLDNFMKDPVSDEYPSWKMSFNVEEKTEAISNFLETYQELRESMEKLVPDMVSYVDFWTRYHFLKYRIETAQARRKDLLRGVVASAEEEVGWDEDSDDESEVQSSVIRRPASAESSTTIQPTTMASEQEQLKPDETRKSQDDKSVADSDASYDVVGIASATTPGSPLDLKKVNESEEDWE